MRSTEAATGADGRALQNARLVVDRELSTRAGQQLGGPDPRGLLGVDPDAARLY